jgi:CheY-like chemotaxis protein
VVGVYAVDTLSRREMTFDWAKAYDFAVELEAERFVPAAHYALLRVLDHADCARVRYIDPTQGWPSVLLEGASPLVLSPAEREAARLRVPVRRRIARTPFVSREVPFTVLAVDVAADLLSPLVREGATIVSRADVDDGVTAAFTMPISAIVCSRRAAKPPADFLGKLAREDPEGAAAVIVVTRRRVDILRSDLRGAGHPNVVYALPTDDVLLVYRVMSGWPKARLAAPAALRRRLAAPAVGEPLTVLLVDVEADVHETLRTVFREESRHVLVADPEEAAAIAFARPFHWIVVSAAAALHRKSFVEAVAREDAAGADRVVVVAPARDVPYVKHKLQDVGRSCRVLALPIDDTILRAEIFRDHPELVARLAAADLATPPTLDVPPAFRRLAVLVVDDDQTTELLSAAADPHDDADVTLATTPMEAFEHVLARPVDLLLASATMRGDGGEPFYRILWRLQPELKARTLLVAAADAVPPSVPSSRASRVVSRPLDRAAVARAVEACRQRSPRAR